MRDQGDDRPDLRDRTPNGGQWHGRIREDGVELSDKHKEMIRKGGALDVLRELRGIPGRIRAISDYQKQLARKRKQVSKQNKALNKWMNDTFFNA